MPNKAAMLFFDMETTGLGQDALPNVGVVRRENGSHEVFHSGHGQTMTAEVASALLDLLLTAGPVCSFNGAGFDFRVLANILPGRKSEIAELASGPQHFDLMLDWWAQKGYPAGMSSFAGGEKTQTGKWAVDAWSTTSEAQKVIDYCKSDTDALARLWFQGTREGRLDRTAKNGKPQKWFLKKKRFRSVSEATAAYYSAPPDVSWMSEPPDFAAVLAWA